MTIQEWLNNDQLGIDIWEKKYRYNNETLDEWFDRVSGGDPEIRQLIVEKKFLFGGRTLANRGTNNGSYSNCFTGDAIIRTKRGLVPICDIVIGDYVLTDKNRYCRVNNIMCRTYTGDLYKFSSEELYAPIICTPNHQFLTNFGWKRADRIFPSGVSYSGKGNDKLKTAFDSEKIYSNVTEGELIDFSENFICDENKRLYVEKNKIGIEGYVNCSNIKGKPIYSWKKCGNSVNKTVIFNSDFAYFIGRWLGDGSITRRKGHKNPSILQIVFNASTEQNIAKKCAEIGQQIFGISPSIRKTEQNVIAVRFENEIISSWFLNTFGEKCNNKKVPNKYLGNYNMLLGLFDADGFLSTHGRFKIVLKNKNLLTWARDTCYLNNINAGSIKDISHRQIDTFEMHISTAQSNGRLNKDMHKHFFDKETCNRTLADYINIPNIEILENQTATVYNLSVEDDHTYTVNGVIVHNCYSEGFCPDSLDGIMDTAKNIAMTYKAQGGQGISLSKIRPKGSLIAGKFKSDGIVPFMEIFNTVTESVSQGGSRKGALLMSLDINHPEAETFMTIKSDLKRINKANLSMEIDNDFMERVLNGDSEANRLFNILCEQACKYAEPGVILTDRFRNYNLMEFVDSYQIETCNPCGEQPLKKYSACSLSSINLSEYVINPFTNESKIDYQSLANDIFIYVRAMDDVLEENLVNHPLPQQRKAVEDFRNQGIGIMGMHDMFIKMGIIYGSNESIDLVTYLINFIFKHAIWASVSLAKERGNFPGYDPRIWDSNIIKFNFTEQEILELKNNNCLRNCSLLSVAPNGSIGTMLSISTGVEPWFAKSYIRNTKSLNGTKDVSYEVWAPVIKQAIDLNWHPETLITSNDINYHGRIKIQAALQHSIDTAISSTINLPKNTTPEQIREIYIEAWQHGLKGITVYVDGSRDPILTTSKIPTQITDCPKRPEILPAKLVRFKNGKENWIAFVGLLNNKPYEIFTGINNMDEFPVPSNINEGEIIKIKDSNGKRYDFIYTDSYGYINRLGGLSRIFNQEYWNYAKLISALLRGGIELDKVIKIIDGLQIESNSFNTWKSGIKRALKSFIEDGTTSSEKCPECGENLIYQNGCKNCPSCGFSACG